tara:strand:- start:1481 stop:1789 length:309 start_codon:yes stop_codon:yes gene_type:complete
VNDITNAEQEALAKIMSSRQADASEKEAKAVARKIRQRRKMTAAYKAHKTLEALYPEEYQRIYNAAFEALGSDERYDEENPMKKIFIPIPGADDFTPTSDLA